MIRTDGVRSLRLKQFAGRKLSQIIDIDVPSKTLIFNGFTISVHQQDDINGGYVKAPMGLRVICSNDKGIKCFTADFFSGAVEGRADMYAVDLSVSSGATLTSLFNKTEVSETEISTLFPYIYGEVGSYDFTYLGSLGSYYWRATNCRPVTFPLFNSEGFIFTVSLTRANGYNSSTIYEAQLLGYGTNGSGIIRTGWARETDQNPVSAPCVFNLPSLVLRSVATYQGSIFNIVAPQSASIATVFEGTWDVWAALSDQEKENQNIITTSVRHITSDVVFVDVLPAVVYNITNPNGYNYNSIIGSYSYSLGQDKGVNLLTAMFTSVTDMTTLIAGFEDIKWIIYYTLYQDGPNKSNPGLGSTVHTVTLGEMASVLDLLFSQANDGVVAPAYSYVDGTSVDRDFVSMFASVPISYTPGDPIDLSTGSPDLYTNYSVARIFGMLGAHMAYPNSRLVSKSRSDSIMFHGPLGVYSWTRKYGVAPDGSCRLVLFGTTGLELIHCFMPIEVTTTLGVRPNITYAGNNLFFCICERVSAETTDEVVVNEVTAIYTGSPFSGWSKSPEFTGGTLLHARPVSLTPETLVVFGVCETANEAGITARRATFLDTSNENTKWTLLSVIPTEGGDGDIWDISLYGDGPYVQMLQSYLSRPHTVPQYVWEGTIAEDYIEFHI